MGLYSDFIFPWLIERESNDPRLAAIRRSMLRGVSGRILEIGFGTGADLPFYPPEVRRLVIVEPSAGMNRSAARHVAAWGGEIEPHRLAGERLPFPDASFDTVVVAFLLCSVADPAAVLAETRRVLRPGGAYHLLEHVISSDPRARAWQRRLDGLNAAVWCGCHLVRDTEPVIAAAGFRFDWIERGPLHSRGLMRPLLPGIWGRAVRAG